MITGSVSNGCQLLCQLYQYHPTNTHFLRNLSEITGESRDNTGRVGKGLRGIKDWARVYNSKSVQLL